MSHQKSVSRAHNESLDLFTAACSDMKLAAHGIADAYKGMHAAILEMDHAWQRMARHAAHMKSLLARKASITLPVYRGNP